MAVCRADIILLLSPGMKVKGSGSVFSFKVIKRDDENLIIRFLFSITSPTSDIIMSLLSGMPKINLPRIHSLFVDTNS